MGLPGSLINGTLPAPSERSDVFARTYEAQHNMVHNTFVIVVTTLNSTTQIESNFYEQII